MLIFTSFPAVLQTTGNDKYCFTQRFVPITIANCRKTKPAQWKWQCKVNLTQMRGSSQIMFRWFADSHRRAEPSIGPGNRPSVLPTAVQPARQRSDTRKTDMRRRLLKAFPVLNQSDREHNPLGPWPIVCAAVAFNQPIAHETTKNKQHHKNKNNSSGEIWPRV